MQVEPMKPMLKAPGTKRLKLEYDELLRSFAFKLYLRRYTKVGFRGGGTVVRAAGNHLLFGDVQCRFGSVSGSAHVVSSALLFCETPVGWCRLIPVQPQAVPRVTPG